MNTYNYDFTVEDINPEGCVPDYEPPDELKSWEISIVKQFRNALQLAGYPAKGSELYNEIKGKYLEIVKLTLQVDRPSDVLLKHLGNDLHPELKKEFGV